MLRIKALDDLRLKAAALKDRDDEPGISSYELFDRMLKRFSRLKESHKRSFQRRLSEWSATTLLTQLRSSKGLRIVIGVRKSDFDRKRDLHEGFDIWTAAELGKLAVPGSKTTLEWQRIPNRD